MKRYRALFLTSTVPQAAGAIRGWLAAGHEIAQIWRPELIHWGVLHRDRRLGLLAPRWSVTAIARRNRIRVLEVPRLSRWDGALRAVREVDADVLVSVYFPFVVPAAILEEFGARAVNLHPAPLPRYRGFTPVAAMIADRTLETDGSMTLHVMTPAIDAGDIIELRPVPFPQDRCLVGYSLNLAQAARSLVQETLPAYLAGRISAVPQDESRASYRRTTQSDLLLGAHLDADTMRWRCDVLGRRRGVGIDSLPGARAVGFGRILGPSQNAPAKSRLLSVDLDAADARVRLKRKRPWSSLWNKVRAQAIMVTRGDGRPVG